MLQNTCQLAIATQMMLLAHWITKYDELRACQRSLKLNYKSESSEICVLWITVEQLLFQYFVRRVQLFERYSNSIFPILSNFKSPHLGIWGSSNDFETMMRIAQDLVESCELRRPNKYVLQPYKLSSTLFAKVCLTLVQHLFSTSPPSNFAKMCSEPELQEAERLYHIPGKWDVDEKCVSTLQTISVKNLRYMMTSTFSPPVGEFRTATDEMIWLSLSLSEIPDVSEHYLNFLKEYSDYFLQSFWYPPFKRFFRHARQRSQNNSSIVSVSCKGLQGSRDEVYNTILQLLRLMIVNELHHRKFDLYGTCFFVTFSYSLPILLQLVL